MRYSREQRDRAVDLYVKYEHSAADVIRELGYPSRTILYVWYRERLEEERTGVPSKRGERRRYRSMTADPNRAPLSLDTLSSSLPALAVTVRSYLAALAISSASASSIVFNSSVTFSATRRSSPVSSRFRSICMMFEGLGSVSCLPIAVFCFGE